jgi:hypothetical protein
MSALPVACRGGAASGAIVRWSNGYWAVTSYGMAEIEGFHAIPADTLADLDINGQLRWLAVMDAAGIDLDSFIPALAVALALHGYTSLDPALVPKSAKAYRKNLRRLAYEASVRAADAARARKTHKRKRQEVPMQTTIH